MYKIGDYVFHKRCGICLVKDIAPLSGDDSGDLYFVLSPLYGDDKTNIVRVPVGNSVSLRDPIEKSELEVMIRRWPIQSLDLYITDSKKRKASYETALTNGSLDMIAPLLAGAMSRKAKDGHLNSMDAQFVSRAQPLIYGGVSFALGIEYQEVPNYLAENCGKEA